MTALLAARMTGVHCCAGLLLRSRTRCSYSPARRLRRLPFPRPPPTTEESIIRLSADSARLRTDDTDLRAVQESFHPRDRTRTDRIRLSVFTRKSEER